jgi:hypothetical protein
MIPGSLAPLMLAGSGRLKIALALSGNQANYVLNTAKVTGYIAGQTDVVLTVNAGAVIGSTSTSTYALNVDTSWSVGDTVKIVNAGTIEGKGGAGGAGNGGAGGAGGPALRCQRAVSIDNGSGVIASGGNGGTGGANTACYVTYGLVFDGKGYSCGYSPSYVYPGGGAGGKGAGAEAAGTYAAAGGAGGGYAGLDCASQPASPPYAASGNSGGALGGGAYITGNANVTWLANGTLTGSVIA